MCFLFFLLVNVEAFNIFGSVFNIIIKKKKKKKNKVFRKEVGEG